MSRRPALAGDSRARAGRRGPQVCARAVRHPGDHGLGDVKLVQGGEDSVFIEGDEEAQGAARLDVEDGVLRVRPSGAWKFWRSKQLMITVTARDLKRIEISGAADVVAAEPVSVKQIEVRISGAGSVRLDKLKAEKLEVSIAGIGSAQAAGSADTLQVRISGRGAYLGENLASKFATLSVSGAGDVKVWATKELDRVGVGVADVPTSGAARRSAETTPGSRPGTTGATSARRPDSHGVDCSLSNPLTP